MIEIDLPADLNAQDDDGLGWSILRETPQPTEVRPGVNLVAGNSKPQQYCELSPWTLMDGSIFPSCLARLERTHISSIGPPRRVSL